MKHFQFFSLNAERIRIKSRMVNYYWNNIKFAKSEMFSGDEGVDIVKTLGHLTMLFTY